MAPRGELIPSDPIATLPPGLVREILRRLPADQLARVACVSLAWRAAVADPALWRRLDFSVGSGCLCTVAEFAVRAAAARAGGSLEALDLTGRPTPWAAVRAVAVANAASLREVRTLYADEAEPYGNGFPPAHDPLAQLEALLAEAPRLPALEANLKCTLYAAEALLRAEPPFGPLRLQRLDVDVVYMHLGVGFAGLVAKLIAHPWLRELGLWGKHNQLNLDEWNLVADAALTLRLTAVYAYSCMLSPAAAPALARLLSSAELTTLLLCNEEQHGGALLDAPAAALLSAALRANRTLTSLTLADVGLWADAPAAVTLLGALTGHASLRTLECDANSVWDEAAAAAIGVALGALLAADAPALEELDVTDCDLGDEGLGPLVDALPRNSHLRALHLAGNGISTGFAAHRLLPAARGNTSLRMLDTAGSAFAAERHVAERALASGRPQVAMPLLMPRETAAVVATRYFMATA
jgi:hypothetical protein